ncbi:MAG: SapC family protein [Pseudomonadota bacterium]
MFQDLKIISPQADATTRYSDVKDWAFAAELTAIPVTRDELGALAQEYAIVFSNTSPSYPMAVLGLDGKNCYINAAAQWTAQNVPTRLAIYPFGSSVIDGKTELVRDVGACHFDKADGKSLFDGQGNPTELMDHVTTIAARAHLGMKAIGALTAQLQDAGLLADTELAVDLKDGSQYTVNGFKAVNAAALAKLDQDVRSQLEASGAMALLAAHQQSLVNFNHVLEAVSTQAASPAKKTAKTAAAKTK